MGHADRPADGAGSTFSRRALRRTAGAAGAAGLMPRSVLAGVPAETTPAVPVAATGSEIGTAPASAGPLMNLTARETEILSAMVDRLIRSDELGAGSLDAGALRFIGRSLVEGESDSAGAYL